MKNKVLHIASHMGGGVGKVLSNVALHNDERYEHHIILLEKPIDTVFTDKIEDKLTIMPSLSEIIGMVIDAEIVQFDFWNHPLMAGLMHNLQGVPMRSVVWSHTAGCYYPYIKPEFVTMPDHFIFSSQYTRDNKFWTLQDLYNMTNISVVNSSGGFTETRNIPLKEHDGFNIGYVGTLGYVKLNPDFIKYCDAVSNIPNVKFVMIGRIPEPNLVLRDAKEAGIDDLFEFKGWVPYLPVELAKLDVLGYLLNPYHFGTTENALLEAMSMSIPPIVINQCAEKYLVEHGQSGYKVHNPIEYKGAMNYLYENPTIRKKIGTNARNRVTSNLELGNTIQKLNHVYNVVMWNNKRRIEPDLVFGKTPFDWYQAGLPPGGLGKISQYLVDSTKGSVNQWAKYYPQDERLAELVKR